MPDANEFVVQVQWDPFRVRILPVAARPGQPVTAILTIGASLMPTQLSVDDTTGTAKLVWVDDKGDTDAAAPANAAVEYGIDNAAVATIDAATGQITPVAEGDANVTVTITDTATGGQLMEADGVTPFQAQPAAFSVVAGTAVGAGLQITA